MTIGNLYGLKFRKKKIFNDIAYIAESSQPQYQLIGNFLCTYLSASQIDSDIADLDQVLNGQSSEFITGDESTYIRADVNEIDFVLIWVPNPSLANPNLTIPTQDFKEILIEFQKYIKKEEFKENRSRFLKRYLNWFIIVLLLLVLFEIMRNL